MSGGPKPSLMWLFRCETSLNGGFRVFQAGSESLSFFAKGGLGWPSADV